MNRHESNNKLLQLNWNFGRAYSESMSDELMTEFLNPRDFSDPDYINNYWSKPEIMLGFNVLMDAAMSEDQKCHDKDNCFNISTDFLKISHMFYQLVTTLGQCAYYYTYYRDILERVKQQKELFIIYWEKHKATISQYSELSPNSPEVQIEADRIIAAIQDYRRIFDHEKECSILKAYGVHHWISEPISSAEPTRVRWIFANSVKRFFEDYLNQPIERTAVTKLDIMNQCLGEVGKSSDRDICDWWTMRDIDNIWNNLQDVASSICEEINKQGCNHGQPWHMHLISAKNRSVVRTKANDFINAAEKMGISTSQKLRAYISDIKNGKKCIAYTKVGCKHFVAFSGYIDSTDEQVNEYWKLDFYAFLSALCRSRGVILAHLSPSVVSEITHYENGYEVETFRKRMEKEYQKLIYSYPPTPQKEIPHKIVKAIGIAYSCCERKILTTLKQDNIRTHEEATMFVLLSPCQSCSDALRAWEQKYKWKWTVQYGRRYKSK